MLRHRLYLLLSLCCCCFVTATAQSSIKRFTTADGLSDNSTLCALRDSYGFLWVGTENGLSYFDGHGIHVYRDMLVNQQPHETNSVLSLYEHNRDIWFGGTAGLYVFSRKNNTYTRFDHKTRYGIVISSAVPKIIGTDNGVIWIPTMGQGLFTYHTGSDSLSQDSRHGSFFCDITTGIDGLIYAVTLSGQVVVFRNDGQYLYTISLENYNVDKNQVCIARKGSEIWLGHGTTLLQLEQGEKHFIVHQLPNKVGTIHDLLSSQGGTLFLASDNGIFRYTDDKQQLESVGTDREQSLYWGEEATNKLAWDTDSSLLAMTNSSGICMIPINHEGISFYNIGNDKHTIVNVLCPAPDGSLWVGTTQGLFRWSEETGFSRPANPIGHDINALAIDDRQLWIGTRHNGIIVVDTESGHQRSYTYSSTIPYTISSNEVKYIFRTKAGDIYVLTSWGLSLYNRKADHFTSFASISAMTSFICMAEAADGRLWASSSNRGLYYKRPDSNVFDSFNSKTIGNQTVVLMHCDQQGVLWMATNGGGLYRYDKEQEDFVRFDTEGTLLHDMPIQFIEEDAQGALFLGSESVMVRIGASRDVRDIEFFAINRNINASNTQQVSCLRKSGNILVGAVGGIYSLSCNQTKPMTDLQHVYILSISFPWANDSRAELQRLGLDALLYTREHIELPYADNSFTLHFASSRYHSMADTKYEFMLEGFDKTWARGTSTPEATYSNLPPGEYRFLLRQAGKTDADDIQQLRITVLPPWYRSGLAYVVYFLLLVGSVFFFYFREQRRLKRRYQRQLNEYRNEQEKETFQTKIRFFVDLVHEIRTPLTLMSLPLEELENRPTQLGEESVVKTHLSAIRRNMDYLLGITNQLLDFQKAEHGKMTIMPRRVNLGEMLQDICNQFYDAVKVQGKQLQLQLPSEPVSADIDLDKMNKVMMNLVSNAMKYAKHDIIVSLTQQSDGAIRIAVVDDGHGVPPEERDKIFDRYYQIGHDSVATTLGTGLGLAYAKMLAEAHHGDLEYEDAPGGGSCFVLTLFASEAAAATALPPTTATAERADTAEEAEKVHSKTTDEPPVATAHNKYCILFVEDNEELLKATASGLKEWYKVVKAHDGVEALDLLKYNEIDIIVSDLMMPRMDGIELCQHVKSNIETSHLPLILLTAKTTVQSKTEGMESGADIYMEKPFSMRQLHLQIENLIKLRQQFYERMKSIDGYQSKATDTNIGLNQQNLHFVEQLQQLVDANMRDEEFSIDTLAEQLNMSRSSFYRKIKALTGLSPNDYLKTARMNQAARLLREGCRSNEVAERVGFSSSSYFAKCFKAQFGVLPKDFA